MSITEHTPGPWWLGAGEYSNNIEANDPLLRGGNNLVKVATVFEITDDETQHVANARLIAAAPAMLDALMAVDALGMLNPTGSGTVEDAARAVKAAIAAALSQTGA